MEHLKYFCVFFLNYNAVECLGEMLLKEKNPSLVNSGSNLHTQGMWNP